tara:strand:+ start:4120 stop:5040 length:921 start_codon:yes stop_codon:yes gene_type:complete
MKADELVQNKQTLHQNLWFSDKINPQARRKLMKIAMSFFEGLDLPEESLEDVTVTGSLANFNWTKFSDIDLHLIVDFSLVDSNTDLVGEYFRAKTSNWNRTHKIKLFAHEVEIYIQNKDEPHHSSGVYSLKSDDWIVEPQRKEVNVDAESLRKKANVFVDMIERADDLYIGKEYEKAYDFAKQLFDKIKNFRKAGLEAGGEYSLENLTFKYLRSNEYIKFLNDLRTAAYDKMMSLNGDYEKKFKIFISQDKETARGGFDKLTEIENFQRRVANKHDRLKRLTLGLTADDIAGKRSPSAPAGFGGSV